MKCPKCGVDNIEGIRTCSQCGTSLRPESDSPLGNLTRDAGDEVEFKFNSGDIFGERYRIVEEVGRGGMGSVYTAEDLELNIVVALKVIHPEYTRSPRFIQQFKKEILLAREITHENVVRIHDFGEVDDIKFISMQYVEGESLDDLILNSGPLDIHRALNICRQICQGLSAAHRKGIVHLDLKPHNILVDKHDHVFIVDFGLAKSMEGGRARLTSKILATPEYISPEQARGQDVDQRTDIYALGCIMYEMMTGKPLFTSETVLGYIQKHIHEIPSMPSKSNRQISTYLDKLILKCLEKRPQRRYQGITEIMTDLDEERVKAGPFFWLIRLRKYLMASFWLILAVLLTILVVIVMDKLSEPATSKGRSVAVLRFDNISDDKRLDHMERSLAILLTADLNQSIYFRVLSENRLHKILQEIDYPDDITNSPEAMRELASRGNLDYLLIGHYSLAGDNLRIIVNVIDVRHNRNLFTVKEDGKGLGSFHSIVDQLTPRIKRRFELSWEQIRTDNDREVGKITTDSIAALQHYAAGMSYYIETKHEKSIEELRQAVEIDPDFAMAHYYIAVNYSYIGDNKDIYEYIEKAIELKERVSEKEFYMIQAFEYSDVKYDRKKAIGEYKKLLKAYPEDEEGHEFLGAKYRNLEQWEEAIASFQNLIKVNRNRDIAYQNLVNLNMKLGRYDEALDVMESAEEIFGAESFIHFFRSRIYLCQHKFGLARSEARQALQKDPDKVLHQITLGNLHQITGDLSAAEEIYAKLSKRDEDFPRLKGYHWLTCLYLQQGRLEKARMSILEGIKGSRDYDSKEFEAEFEMLATQVNLQFGRYQEALASARRALKLIEDKIELLFLKRIALFNLGQVYFHLNDINKTEETISRLEGLPDAYFDRIPLRNIQFLKGLVAAGKQDYSRAIELLRETYHSLLYQQSNDDDRHALYLDALASVYLAKGDIDRAIRTYEEIGELTFGRLLYGAVYVESLYKLAKCYLKRKWRGKAKESFEKFLSLWQDADIDAASLNDARRQLPLLD